MLGRGGIWRSLGGDLEVAVSVIPGRGGTHLFWFWSQSSPLFRIPRSRLGGGVVGGVVRFCSGLPDHRWDEPP